MIATRSAANLLLLCAGMAIWSSAFISLYATLSIGCAFGWEDISVGPVSLQRAMLVGVWLCHLAAIGGLLVWTRRRHRRARPGADPEGFLARTTLWATIVALGVTVANYAPIVGLSACL